MKQWGQNVNLQLLLYLQVFHLLHLFQAHPEWEKYPNEFE